MNNGGPFVKAFLSYNHQDRDILNRLSAALERAGIDPWGYETELPFGHGIPAEIRRNLGSADYCIVLLTPASIGSAWVARELGLARRLQESRDPRRPYIIGVTAGLASPPTIALRDFETARETGDSINFSDVRCLTFDDSSDDDLAQLLRRLAPAVMWLSDGQYEESVADQVFACYEALFPVEEERDPRVDIELWIREALVKNPVWEPWSEYFAALRLDDAVLGIAWFSFQHSSQWCGGCYFGVRKAWRDRNRASHLLQQVTDRFRREWPAAKGILFEIEMVDIPLLKAAARCQKLADFPNPDILKDQIHRLARLLIYQSSGCRAFVTQRSVPVNVVQPALQEPLTARNEQPMMLMLLRTGAAPADALNPEEVLNFWYLDFYGQSHDSTTAAEIARYREYVTRLKDRVVRQAKARGFSLGVVQLPSAVRQLPRRAEAEGFIDSVEL